MRAAFVEWLFASSPAAVRRWVPEERLRADLGAYFDRIWTERADTTRPFVGVFAQTRELADHELARAAEELVDTFAVFGSRSVRWWSPEERELRHLPGARGDERVVIGRVEDITAAVEPALPDGLAMQPETVSTCYDDYRRAYDDFASRNVLLKNLPRCETRESLQECADRGALCYLRDDGRFAGLMAAREIYDDNLPSLRTACGAGRKDVGGWIFIDT